MESRGWDIPVPATDAINEANLRFVIPTEAYPYFLLRSATSGRVCGFRKKAA
jgi:hypothetical protein